MNIREYKGFEIHSFQQREGYVADVYRKEKILKTVW